MDASTRHNLMEQVNGARAAATEARLQARATALASKRSDLLEALPRRERETGKEPGSAASLAAEINASLRRATAVVAEEVGRSNAAGNVVEESSRRLRMTRDQHGRYGDTLASGGETLGQIRRTKRVANVAVGVSFFVFFAVAFFVARKRVVNSNLATFVVRPTMKVVFAPVRILGRFVAFAFGSGGKGEGSGRSDEGESASEAGYARAKAREGRERDAGKGASDMGAVSEEDDATAAGEGGTVDMRDNRPSRGLGDAGLAEEEGTHEILSATVATDGFRDAEEAVNDTVVDFGDRAADSMPVEDKVIQDDRKDGAGDDKLVDEEAVEDQVVMDETADSGRVENEPNADKVVRDKGVDDRAADDEHMAAKSAIDNSVGGKPVDYDEAVTGKVVQDEPVGDEAVRDKTADDKPVDGEPGTGELVQDKVVEDKALGDESVDGEPDAGELSQAARVEDTAVGDKSVDGRPGEDADLIIEPIDDEPVQNKPAEEKPVIHKSVDEHPMDDATVDGTSAKDEALNDDAVNADAFFDVTDETVGDISAGSEPSWDKDVVGEELVVDETLDNISVGREPSKDKDAVVEELVEVAVVDKKKSVEKGSIVSDNLTKIEQDQTEPIQDKDPVIEEATVEDSVVDENKTVEEGTIVSGDVTEIEVDSTGKAESAAEAEQMSDDAGGSESAKETAPSIPNDAAQNETEAKVGSKEEIHEDL